MGATPPDLTSSSDNNNNQEPFTGSECPSCKTSEISCLRCGRLHQCPTPCGCPSGIVCAKCVPRPSTCNVNVCFPRFPLLFDRCPHCDAVGLPCYQCHQELNQTIDCKGCGGRDVKLVHRRAIAYCQSPPVPSPSPSTQCETCRIKDCSPNHYCSTRPCCPRCGTNAFTRELVNGGIFCQHCYTTSKCAICGIIGAPDSHICDLPPAQAYCCSTCGEYRNIRWTDSRHIKLYCQTCDAAPPPSSPPTSSSPTPPTPSPPPPSPPECPFTHECWEEAKKCPCFHTVCGNCGSTKGNVKFPHFGDSTLCSECFVSSPKFVVGKKAPIRNEHQHYSKYDVFLVQPKGGGFIRVPLNSLPLPDPQSQRKGIWAIDEQGTLSFQQRPHSFGTVGQLLPAMDGGKFAVALEDLPPPFPAFPGKWILASNAQLFYQSEAPTPTPASATPQTPTPTPTAPIIPFIDLCFNRKDSTVQLANPTLFKGLNRCCTIMELNVPEVGRVKFGVAAYDKTEFVRSVSTDYYVWRISFLPTASPGPIDNSAVVYARKSIQYFNRVLGEMHHLFYSPRLTSSSDQVPNEEIWH